MLVNPFPLTVSHGVILEPILFFFLFSSMTARMSSGHDTLIILMTATYSRLSTKTNMLAKVKLLATLENYHLLVVNW